MIRLLSDEDLAAVLDLADLLPVVADAFERQGRGAVERPDRPHFPVGRGLHPDDADEPLGTGLCMPASLHGAETFATKLVAVHEDNAERGLPTVNAQIALTDAETGLPVGYFDGTRITNARTGCIGGLAARELALEGPVRAAILGAGTQARWQARAIDAATDLESIDVYSPSESKRACATDLETELGVPANAASSAREAVADATVVVTATTSTEPVFPGDELAPGTLVIAVGAYTAEMRELDSETIDRAARIFADVPEEVAAIGDLRDAGADGSPPDADDLTPFADVVAGRAGRSDPEEILVVESVGTAVLDAAAAEHVLERARAAGVGRTVSL